MEVDYWKLTEDAELTLLALAGKLRTEGGLPEAELAEMSQEKLLGALLR